MKVTDVTEIRSRNASAMLRLIWEEQQISRADIARRSGLSRSTVSAIVEVLLGTGVIREAGAGDSSGGRRPIILEFDEHARALVGVDIGASHVGVALTDLRGHAEVWLHVDHNVRDDPAGTLGQIERLVAEALEKSSVSLDDVVGVGISVPSPVDVERSGHLSPEVLPAWKDVNIVRALEKSFGRPTFVDNDANLGALAELWWGAGQGGGDLAFVKIGTGVGCGLIVNGKIHRGFAGLAGEIGHMSIVDVPKGGEADPRGRLTALVGAKEIVSQVEMRLPDFPQSHLCKEDEPLSVRSIAQAAAIGDVLAVQSMTEAGHYLGVAIANLLNVLNPKTVVLGGGISLAGPVVLNAIEAAVSTRTVWEDISRTPVVVSELGEYGMAVGAATQVLDLALRDYRLFESSKSSSVVSS